MSIEETLGRIATALEKIAANGGGFIAAVVSEAVTSAPADDGKAAAAAAKAKADADAAAAAKAKADALTAANPFPGLRAFRPGEADRFFGRQQQIDELVARLAALPFIAVSGASGCGKSSLARAIVQLPPPDAGARKAEPPVTRALYGQVAAGIQSDGYPERLLHWVETIPQGIITYCGHDTRSTGYDRSDCTHGFNSNSSFSHTGQLELDGIH